MSTHSFLLEKEDETCNNLQLFYGLYQKFWKKKCYTIFHCKLKSRDFGFVGPSGSGKTTLIKMIAGINEATKGEVLVNNTNMPNLNEMKRIGYMAQADALYEELSAYENADFIATMYGLKENVKRQELQRFLNLYNCHSI